MAEYSVTFARSARHELEVLASSIIRRIISKIESLAVHPRQLFHLAPSWISENLKTQHMRLSDRCHERMADAANVQFVD